MSKTVCKCGAEYEDEIPFGDEQVDSCPRCSKYARATPAEMAQLEKTGGPGLRWKTPKPKRVLD